MSDMLVGSVPQYSLEFEWDENKRRLNLGSHGIDFEDAITIGDRSVHEFRSSQTHHGEERFVAVGRLGGLFITGVFVWRGNRRRIISARVARRDERRDYS